MMRIRGQSKDPISDSFLEFSAGLPPETVRPALFSDGMRIGWNSEGWLATQCISFRVGSVSDRLSLLANALKRCVPQTYKWISEFLFWEPVDEETFLEEDITRRNVALAAWPAQSLWVFWGKSKCKLLFWNKKQRESILGLIDWFTFWKMFCLTFLKTCSGVVEPVISRNWNTKPILWVPDTGLCFWLEVNGEVAWANRLSDLTLLFPIERFFL